MQLFSYGLFIKPFVHNFNRKLANTNYKKAVKIMALNPRFKISIQYEEGQEDWVEIMKQELKDRLIQVRYDYFAVIEEAEKDMIVSFIPSVVL